MRVRLFEFQIRDISRLLIPSCCLPVSKKGNLSNEIGVCDLTMLSLQTGIENSQSYSKLKVPVSDLHSGEI